jgi:hypothetical protein
MHFARAAEQQNHMRETQRCRDSMYWGNPIQSGHTPETGVSCRGVRLWILLLTACISLPSFAQECKVTLSIGAFDRDLHKVPGLSAPDFNLKAGDTPISIGNITTLSARRFIIVMDASRSIRNHKEGRWRYSKAIVGRLIAKAPPESEIGLVILGLGPIVRVAPNTDRAALTKFAMEFGEDSIDEPAGTPLWDAVGHAASALNPTMPGDFVIMLTDGFANEGQLTQEKIPNLLQANSIRLFPLLLENQDRPFDEPGVLSSLSELITQQMNSLAKATGGFGKVIELPWRIKKYDDAEVQEFADGIARNTLDVAFGYYHLQLTVPAELAGKKIKVQLPQPVDKQYTMMQSRLPECSNIVRPVSVR